MLLVNTTPEKSLAILDLCLWKTRSRKSHDAIVFEKFRLKFVVRGH